MWAWPTAEIDARCGRPGPPMLPSASRRAGWTSPSMSYTSMHRSSARRISWRRGSRGRELFHDPQQYFDISNQTQCIFVDHHEVNGASA